jgi:hypothetical protein
LAVCTGFVVSIKLVSVITHTRSDLSAQCPPEPSSREASPVTALPYCFSVFVFPVFSFLHSRPDGFFGKGGDPEREISGSLRHPRFLLYHGWKETFGKPSDLS